LWIGNGAGDEGKREAEREITDTLFPTLYSPLSDALIISKKIGKLLTASIIEFDLLFNAQA
jgi:hypothetical protein